MCDPPVPLLAAPTTPAPRTAMAAGPRPPTRASTPRRGTPTRCACARCLAPKHTCASAPYPPTPRCLRRVRGCMGMCGWLLRRRPNPLGGLGGGVATSPTQFVWPLLQPQTHGSENVRAVGVPWVSSSHTPHLPAASRSPLEVGGGKSNAAATLSPLTLPPPPYPQVPSGAGDPSDGGPYGHRGSGGGWPGPRAAQWAWGQGIRLHTPSPVSAKSV